jgi:hypothetical protein
MRPLNRAEGKKQSIAVYHQAYVDYKDDVRQLRIRLHKVEHEQVLEIFGNT